LQIPGTATSHSVRFGFNLSLAAAAKTPTPLAKSSKRAHQRRCSACDGNAVRRIALAAAAQRMRMIEKNVTHNIDGLGTGEGLRAWSH